MRVLQQIEAGDEASLLCELPKELLEGVKVARDGSVDSGFLFDLCQKILVEQEVIEKKVEETKCFERNQFLMSMIYDSSIAVVNPQHKAA